MDWTLIINWILQGLILAGFIVLGLYVGVRLVGWRPPAAPAPSPRQSGEEDESAVASRVAIAGLDALTPAAETMEREESDLPEVRHAVDFDESGRMTLVVEMPVGMLDNDGSLVDVWIEAVSMARRERAAGAGPVRLGKRRLAVADSRGADDLQQQLDQVLYRLQLSAERRRKLRTMLEDNWNTEEPE